MIALKCGGIVLEFDDHDACSCITFNYFEPTATYEELSAVFAEGVAVFSNIQLVSLRVAQSTETIQYPFAITCPFSERITPD